MQSSTVKVSVLIPAYNYAKYLAEAIDSVLAQSFQDFELIIVDNCSTDNTVALVNDYIKKDKRIRLHINENNIGMWPNHNQALLLANGEYIKFLNADDKFHPALLEKFVAIFDTYPTVSIITSYRQYFGEKTDILKPEFTGLMNGKEAIFNALQSHNWIGEPTTVMFKRKNLTLGLFDTSLLMLADFDMWLRQMQVGDIYIVDQVLSYFRLHDQQGTVHLSDNEDKHQYAYLQLYEYTRYTLQTDRYGYNYTNDYSQKVDTLFGTLAKHIMKQHRYARSDKLHSKKVKTFIYAMIIPYLYNRFKKFVTSIYSIFHFTK